MDEIQRMQDNLLLIRRTVGWSAEEFGNQIGVTRQTINNIENGRNKLTKTQYIAMRSVLDAEIARCPDEMDMLCTMLDIFVDHPEKYKDEDRAKPTYSLHLFLQVRRQEKLYLKNGCKQLLALAWQQLL